MADKNNLILDNMGFADCLAMKYAQRHRLDFSELRSAAYEGLVIAANEYKEDQGAAFQSYAWYWIRKKILLEIGFLLGRGESEVDFDCEDERENVFDAICKQFTLEAIRDAISKLNGNEALLIENYYLYGIPVPEIARMTGAVPSTLWAMKQRALRRLRDILSEKGVSV